MPSNWQNLEALGQIVPVYMPTSAMQQYRRLVKYREVLVGRINQIKNSIRSLLDAQGKQLGSRAKAWTIEGVSVLEKYRKPYGECGVEGLWRDELDVELTLLDKLWEQQGRLEKKLDTMAKQEERVQLLMTIPGVGRRTAEVVVTIMQRHSKNSSFVEACHRQNLLVRLVIGSRLRVEGDRMESYQTKLHLPSSRNGFLITHEATLQK